MAGSSTYGYAAAKRSSSSDLTTSQAQSGTITLDLARGADVDGEWAVVCVHDHGVGIPAAELGCIFDRFYRGSNARHIAGTGLGLSGARDIVEAHGGAISIASRPGGGTTVTVRLPLAPEGIMVG
jgi:signal transduction histidine kinase